MAGGTGTPIFACIRDVCTCCRHAMHDCWRSARLGGAEEGGAAGDADDAAGSCGCGHAVGDNDGGGAGGAAAVGGAGAVVVGITEGWCLGAVAEVPSILTVAFCLIPCRRCSAE